MFLVLLSAILLRWTAPQGCMNGARIPQCTLTSYACLGLDEFGVRWTVPLFADSLCKVPRGAPSAPGMPDWSWISQSDDGRARLYRIVSFNALGQVSGPSTPVIEATGLSDTSYFDFSANMPPQAKRAKLNPWSGKFGSSWTRLMGDTSLVVLPVWRTWFSTPIVSQHDAQLTSPAWLKAKYGH